MKSVECIKCGVMFITDGPKRCKACNSGGSELEKERAKSQKLLEALKKVRVDCDHEYSSECNGCASDEIIFKAIADYGEGE